MQKSGRFSYYPKSIFVLRPFSLQTFIGFVSGILFMITFFPPNLRISTLSDHSIIALLNFTRHLSTSANQVLAAPTTEVSVLKGPSAISKGFKERSPNLASSINFIQRSRGPSADDEVVNERKPHTKADSVGEFIGLGKPPVEEGLENDDPERERTEEPIQLKPPKVFCWILTQPKNRGRAIGVHDTWAKRCDKYVFISSESDTELPTVDAGLGEDRKVLWGKTKFGFRYAYRNHLEDFDWFLKADDDTYVVMENLKYLLAHHSRDDPVYFGSHFQKYMEQGYMSGGAGYVMSREALRRLIEVGLNKNACRKNNAGNEDVEMGRCLEKVGVRTGDSRDELGQGRFFPQQATFHLRPGHMNTTFWYGRFAKYPEGDFMDCCSDTAISFHYVKDMYLMEYLIYHLRPYKWNQS